MNRNAEQALRFAARQDAARRCETCGRPAQRLHRWCARCANHRETIAAQQRTYRERHRETIAAKRRTYYERHRETIAAQRRTYYARHRETIAAGKRAAWQLKPPRCERCGQPLEYRGRGRPPRYCAKDKPRPSRQDLILSPERSI